MKRNILAVLGVSAALVLTASTISQDVQTKKTLNDGTVVINTTTIGSKIYGYRDVTPVEISLKGGKVVKVEALPNYETPDYFKLLKDGKLLESWNGLTAEKALEKEVDAVSGATYSSKGIIDNVREGLKFYLGKTDKK